MRSRLSPDLVIRVGDGPTSSICATWLQEAAPAPQIVVAPGRRWRDHLATATHYVDADPAAFCSEVAAGATPHGDGWRRLWARVDGAARSQELGESLSEPRAAATTAWAAMPPKRH